MNKILALGCLFAAPLLAGPLRFSPKTVCAGDRWSCPSDSVFVHNLSKDTALLVPAFELSPFQGPDRVVFSTHASFTNSFETDSGTGTKVGGFFRQPVVTLGMPRIRIAPRDSLLLTNLHYESCTMYAVRASGSASIRHRNCTGESVDLVFGSVNTGYDTLPTRAFPWLGGGAVLPTADNSTAASRKSQFLANGKAAKSRASGVELGTNGSTPWMR